MNNAPVTRRKAGENELPGASWQKAGSLCRHRLGRPPSARRATAPERDKKRPFLLDRLQPVFFSARRKRKWGVECPSHHHGWIPRPMGQTHWGRPPMRLDSRVQWDAPGASRMDNAPGGNRIPAHAHRKRPGLKGPGRVFLWNSQQQGAGLQPQLLLQPQPQPEPPQLPLPQQHQMMISRMMIQQQLPPPKPLLHISEPPMNS